MSPKHGNSVSKRDFPVTSENVIERFFVLTAHVQAIWKASKDAHLMFIPCAQCAEHARDGQPVSCKTCSRRCQSRRRGIDNLEMGHWAHGNDLISTSLTNPICRVPSLLQVTGFSEGATPLGGTVLPTEKAQKIGRHSPVGRGSPPGCEGGGS